MKQKNKKLQEKYKDCIKTNARYAGQPLKNPPPYPKKKKEINSREVS